MTTEPEWDAESLDLVRAMADVQADTHTCGHPAEESFHPDNEGAYTAGPPARCHACTAIAKRREDYREAPHASALMFTARHRDDQT